MLSCCCQDEAGSGSNSGPLVACYLAAAYYIYTYTSTQDRGHHVRDGITDWGQYPK